jgi:2-methylaconitate cis-trans-isomerase PrpF
MNARTLPALGLLTAALLVATAAPASAKSGDATLARGACAGGGAVWKLKAKHDSGRIETELEVDSDAAGQVWAVRLTDNGVVVLDGTARTAGASGSFSIGLRIADRAGSDTIVATARRGNRTCTGSVTV